MPLAAGRGDPGPGAAAAERSPGTRARAARTRFAHSDLGAKVQPNSHPPARGEGELS